MWGANLEFVRHAATGNMIAAGEITVFRFDGSDHAEEWGLIDSLTLLQRLGAISSD